MNNPGNELFMLRANNYISEGQRKAIGAVRIPAGAIVFAKVGAAVFLERKRILAQDSCIDNNMAAFMIDSARIDVRFAHYLLTAFRLSSLVSTTALPSLNGGQLRSIPLLIPESVTEQRKIAETLAHADELIVTLRRLVAKKKAIKQGMMQQLLSGSTRLPGFSGQWRRSTVGAVADVRTGPFGSTLHERDYVARGTPIITVEHLGEYGVVGEGAPMVSDADFRRLRAYLLKEGDIVFSRVGSIDRNSYVSKEEANWLFSGRLLRVRFDPNLADPRFMSAQFRSSGFINDVRAVAVGQTMPSLNTSILRGISVNLPPLEEQHAIGGVCIDVDSGLQALELRLVKARHLKSGMMQQLLTGRTRLAVVEDAA